MRRISFLFFAFVILSSSSSFAQKRVVENGTVYSVPNDFLHQIVKAEDARDFSSIRNLVFSSNPAVQLRAALAAGRIGDERAVDGLSIHLQNGHPEVRAMAAFALGEIESIKAADAILKTLQDPKTPDSVRARAVEAAGKIAAANPKEPKTKELGEAILDTLENEDRKGATQNRDVILLGLTAALRAGPKNADRERPDDTDFVVAKFLTNLDARIRADAANTLSRVRAKNANAALRSMLMTDSDTVARANAARALGAAEDKEAFNILLEAATEDEDSRVRASAIRSLAALKDPKAADKLLERGEKLLVEYKKSRYKNPSEKNELLEVTVVLGRLLVNTNNEKATKFLKDFDHASKYRIAEVAASRSKIYPKNFLETGGRTIDIRNPPPYDWQIDNWHTQALAELAASNQKDLRKIAEDALTRILKSERSYVLGDHRALPDELRAFAQFKPDDLASVLRPYLMHQDVFSRATAAELVAAQPASKENVDALKKAFTSALLVDKTYNDAQLAILDALYKLDKKESVGTLLVALSAPDYLVRKKAFELLADKDLQKDFPGITTSLEIARSKKKDQVLPYSPAFGTKLGQVLNTETDYRRAIQRKNGTVKAILTTEKGTFTIDLSPEDAPLTVDNFIKLARSNYFNGLEVHRVVPNFVMQDGDPRGDGNGGPGWSIRCEVNMVPYERGVVGMALSGKDTGGSQWFVMHAPQPHLDGGYTVFGRVNAKGMKVVDNIVRGDKIVKVQIVESVQPQRRRGAEKRKN